MSPDDWRLDRTGRREAEQVLERVVLHEDEGQLLFQQSTNRRRKGVQEWITEVSLGHTATFVIRRGTIEYRQQVLAPLLGTRL